MTLTFDNLTLKVTWVPLATDKLCINVMLSISFRSWFISTDGIQWRFWGFHLGATGVATLSSGGHTTNTVALNYRVCNRLYQIMHIILVSGALSWTFWGATGGHKFHWGPRPPPGPPWNRPWWYTGRPLERHDNLEHDLDLWRFGLECLHTPFDLKIGVSYTWHRYVLFIL